MNRNKTFKNLRNQLIFLIIIVITFCCNKRKRGWLYRPRAVNYDANATSIPGSVWLCCIYDSSCLTLIQNVDINNYVMDSYTIDTAFIYDDFLKVNVSYGGGCKDHIFNLVHELIFAALHQFMYLFLTHNSNNDNCRSYYGSKNSVSM